jgi:hypothetical protein
MTRYLLYVVPISLVGFMATAAPAGAALRGDGGVPDAAAPAKNGDAPIMMAQRGGRAGGGFAGARGAGGFSRAGVAGGHNSAAVASSRNWSGVAVSNRSANINRNVNVSGNTYYGRGYYGPGWGGVAAGVAAGAAVGAAATAAATPYYPAPTYYCPYPAYPNCGLY